MSNKKTITIVGHYGKDNIGDESILTVLLYYLNEERCVVLGLNDNKIKKSHNVSAYNLTSLMSIISIFKSRTVIFGGGALLKNTSFLKLSPFIILSKLLGKKIIFFGVDAYLLSYLFKPLIRLCVNKSELICVRNNQSVLNLKQSGITQNIYVCEDMAFMLPKVLEIPNTKKEINKKRVIGINLRPSTFADQFNTNDLLEKTKIQVLKLLSEQPSSVLLIPTQPIDEKILSEFVTSLKKESIVEINWSNHNYNIIEALNSIKNCDLIIGMRYHCLVFAKIMNVPFIAIPYSLKTEIFAKDCGMKIIGNENIIYKETKYESGERCLNILKKYIN
jgi:polysaccharide pyruvyl transferase CsaB